jgi:hypothetical protein
MGKQIFDSEQGLSKVFAEVDKIKTSINQTITNYSNRTFGSRIIIEPNAYNLCDIKCNGYSFLAHFYESALAFDSYLIFHIIKGEYNNDGYSDPFNPPKSIEIITLYFVVNKIAESGWRVAPDSGKFYNTIEITNIWITKFFETIMNNPR